MKTRSGTVIALPQSATGADPANVTDSNGNQISSTGSDVFTDALGANVLTISGGIPRSFTYPVTRQSDNATTASTIMSYQTYTVRTNFQCPNIIDDRSASTSLPDRVTVANGSYYEFHYEGTPGASDGAVRGRLASVTLPTGGTISYSYSGGCSGTGINADGTVGTLTRTTSDETRTDTRSPNKRELHLHGLGR